MVGFLLLISVVFWNDRRMIISITRLPIYTIGMIFAKYDEKTLTKKFIFCEAAGFVFGSIWLWMAFKYAYDYLWNYGLHWYPFILITPFICHAVSLASALLTKNKIGTKFINLLSVVGDYSFEIYLVHVFLFEYLKIWISNNVIEHKNMIWILAFFCIIPWVMLLRFVSNFVRNIFNKII